MHTHWVAICSVLENLTISENTKPGFFMQNSVILEESPSQEHYSGSTKSDQVKNEVVPMSRNDVTITELHPR